VRLESTAGSAHDVWQNFHGCLLSLFAKDPTLLPKDILIMTPDIATYSPFIQAVFSVPPDDPRWIPFSIADRGVRQESQLADTFLSLLDFHGSRFGVSQVMAVLESPAVQKRFSLSEEDLDLIHLWVRETRIRWGVDKESRKDLGLPDFPENTWRAGLDHTAEFGKFRHRFLAAQNKQTGGWRYDPGQDGDTSVVGWQVMALKSAQMAGLRVDPRSLERAKDFLKTCSKGQYGGLFEYRPNYKSGPTPTMTAVGCSATSTSNSQSSRRGPAPWERSS
jgi:hypothetical protein